MSLLRRILRPSLECQFFTAPDDVIPVTIARQPHHWISDLVDDPTVSGRIIQWSPPDNPGGDYVYTFTAAGQLLDVGNPAPLAEPPRVTAFGLNIGLPYSQLRTLELVMEHTGPHDRSVYVLNAGTVEIDYEPPGKGAEVITVPLRIQYSGDVAPFLFSFPAGSWFNEVRFSLSNQKSMRLTLNAAAWQDDLVAPP